MVVTGWSPTAEEEELEGGGEDTVAEGVSCGPGMAVVGMTVVESEGVEDVIGEPDG